MGVQDSGEGGTVQDSRQPIDQLWACYPELGQIPEQDVREIFAS